MTLDRQRLSKLCEMLASDSDGERANAAKLATAMIKKAGMTWTMVIQTQSRQESPWSSNPYEHNKQQQRGNFYKRETKYGQKPFQEDPDRWQPSDHEQECVELSKLSVILTDWETKFLQSIMYQKMLTAKQLGALNRIREKAKNYRAAQAHSAKTAAPDDGECPF